MSFGINNILMVITKRFHKTFDIFDEIDKNKETTFCNAFVVTGSSHSWFSENICLKTHLIFICLNKL